MYENLVKWLEENWNKKEPQPPEIKISKALMFEDIMSAREDLRFFPGEDVLNLEEFRYPGADSIIDTPYPLEYPKY